MRFSLIVTLLLLFNCSPKEITTNNVVKIDIENNTKIELPRVQIKSVIPLETHDSSLFGDVGTIEYFFERIYLLDAFSSKSVMVFSHDGSFINKTKLGKGPGELINPFAFYIDRQKKNVLVWDQTLQTIFRYDLDLNFIDKKRYDRYIMDFAIVNNNEMLVRSHFHKDFTYTLYPYNSESIKKQYIQDFEYPGGIGLFRTITTNNRILLISPFDYNVYQLIGDKLHSEYYFDFGKYKLSQKDVEKNGLEKAWKLTSLGQRVSSLHEIAESEDFILFHVYFKNEPIFYIHSFNTSKTYHLNDYFDKGILPKCKIRGSVEKNTLFAMVEPIDLLEFQQDTGKNLVDNEIDLQQNPLIIKFQISELDEIKSQ